MEGDGAPKADLDLLLQGFWPPFQAGATSYPSLALAMCALPLSAFLPLLLGRVLGLLYASSCSWPLAHAAGSGP